MRAPHGSQKQRVLAYANEHKDATATQIARAIGIRPSHVTNLASRYRFDLRDGRRKAIATDEGGQ